MATATKDFWEDLLDWIEGGNVLPVIGQGVTSIGPADELLRPWLATRLAERLKIPSSSLPAAPTLNDVICRHLLNGGDRGLIYTRIHRILREEKPSPGLTLDRLASIDGFKLFISTTFDDLLVQSLNAKRFNGEELTHVCAYSPERESKDLPGRATTLGGTTVYHILGKVSQVGDYVAWEEDLLEFVCGLHQHMPVMPNLSRDFADPNLRFLMIGLNFSDWLVRFFMRVVRQSRLSTGMDRIDYLAEGPGDDLPKSLIMFFGSVVKHIQVIACEPHAFVAELHARWTARHPDGFTRTGPSEDQSERVIPRGAIFISYAREDEAAARRLKEGLEKFGCVVWYDRERIQTGMDFRHRLEDSVKRDCSLIVSVISRATESQRESFFHLERTWAAERAERYPDHIRSEFYHPVIVDDLQQGDIHHEPRIFCNCQRTKLPGGSVTAEFGRRLYLLQQAHNNTPR